MTFYVHPVDVYHARICNRLANNILVEYFITNLILATIFWLIAELFAEFQHSDRLWGEILFYIDFYSITDVALFVISASSELLCKIFQIEV